MLESRTLFTKVAIANFKKYSLGTEYAFKSRKQIYLSTFELMYRYLLR